MGAQVDQRGQNGMQTHPAGSKPSTQGWLVEPPPGLARESHRQPAGGLRPEPGNSDSSRPWPWSIHTDPSPLERMSVTRAGQREGLEWSGAQEVGGELGPDLVDPGSTQPRGLALHELAQTCLSGGHRAGCGRGCPRRGS